MVSYKSAIKNTNAYKTIIKDKEKNRLSHTYLLISEDMDYVKEFAKMVAQIFLDEKQDSSGSLKIEKDIHPDVLIYGAEEKINTGVVSAIASDVFVRPYESDKKVYILLNMNDANDESQNKLLKTIEEPPKNVMFILGSKTERKLLKTVLSRSKKLELDLLDNKTIYEMLKSCGLKEKECEICSSCSGGVFSRAYRMAMDKEFISMYQNIFKCLYKMNSSRDVLFFASEFANKNVQKEEFSDLFMLIVRDICMVKAGKKELASNTHKIDELNLIAEQFSFQALYKIIEYCLQFKEDLVYNTNINMAIDEFLLHVVEVKVRCKM